MYAATYAMVIAEAFAAGLVIRGLMVVVFPNTLMPWRRLGITLAIAIIFGPVGTTSTVLLGLVSTQQEDGSEPLNSQRAWKS